MGIWLAGYGHETNNVPETVKHFFVFLARAQSLLRRTQPLASYHWLVPELVLKFDPLCGLYAPPKHPCAEARVQWRSPV